MKLGVFNPVMGDISLEETLKFLSARGVKYLEMGCGGYPGDTQLRMEQYLDNQEEIAKLHDLFAKYNMEICSLSCHGNPVSPNRELSEKSRREFEDACKLANQLGVKTITTFSGCPGGSKEDSTPNWITCSWPDEYSIALEYQWNEVLIPYWKEADAIADKYDVNVAIEMHPGFCVYNPQTMKKLREATNNNRIGANYDPSHLFWQQIDPVVAIKEMKDFIYHVHAKDTYLDVENIKKNGVLDTSSYGDLLERSWYFKTVGYGQTEQTWKHIISTLCAIGYDGAISIEHEDSSMSTNEGLEKAIEFLDRIIVKEEAGEAWWF